MTPQQWAESIGGGAVAAIGAVIAAVVVGRRIVAAWRTLMAELARLRSELDAAKVQATTAAQQSATAAKQSTAAATSAAKVDDSIHTNNGGGHLKDFTDEVKLSLTEVKRDIGGIREELRHLSGVDLADRKAAAEVHAVQDRRQESAERRLDALERQPRT